MLAHMHVAAKTMAAVAAAGALVLTIVEMDGRLQSGRLQSTSGGRRWQSMGGVDATDGTDGHQSKCSMVWPSKSKNLSDARCAGDLGEKKEKTFFLSFPPTGLGPLNWRLAMGHGGIMQESVKRSSSSFSI